MLQKQQQSTSKVMGVGHILVEVVRTGKISCGVFLENPA